MLVAGQLRRWPPRGTIPVTREQFPQLPGTFYCARAAPRVALRQHLGCRLVRRKVRANPSCAAHWRLCSAWREHSDIAKQRFICLVGDGAERCWSGKIIAVVWANNLTELARDRLRARLFPFDSADSFSPPQNNSRAN